MVDSGVVSATFPLGPERHSQDIGRTKFASPCLSLCHGGQSVVQSRPRPSNTTGHEAGMEAAGSPRLRRHGFTSAFEFDELHLGRNFLTSTLEEYGAHCLSLPSPPSRKGTTRTARVDVSLIVIVGTAFQQKNFLPIGYQALGGSLLDQEQPMTMMIPPFPPPRVKPRSGYRVMEALTRIVEAMVRYRF